MKIFKGLVICILLPVFAFNSFSGIDSVDEKFTVEKVVLGVYDIPSEKRGMNNLHVFLKIPYSFFRFVKKDDKFAAKYEFTVEVSNRKSDINEVKSDTEEIIISEFEDTNSDKKEILKEFKFEVSPNKYDVRLIINDLDLQKTITKTTEITLKNFWGEKIGISDVILSDYDTSMSSPGKNILIPEPNIDIDYNSALIINYYIFESNPKDIVTLNSKIVHEFYQEEPVYEKNEKISNKNHLIKREIKLTPNDIFTGPYILKINITSGKLNIDKELKFSLLWKNFPVSKIDIDLLLEQMKYVLTDEESEKLDSMSADEKREFFNNFWEEFDKDVSNEENVVMKEYFRRVNYSDQNLTDAQNEGWQSDRGKIWILYGKPSKIMNKRNLIPPYETWEYQNINRRYIFWDEFSTGIFKLKSVYNIRKNNF